MTKYHEVTTAVVVKPEDQDLFGDFSTTVKIDDEGGGAFIVVEQQALNQSGEIRINPDEWPAIRSAIDRMVINAVRLTD